MINLFKVFMSEQAVEAATKTLTSGQIAQGPKVDEFEVALHQFLKTDVKPITVNSCTSALDLAMHLCSIESGSEVITTPMTCVATNMHLLHRKAKVIWADIDPLYGTINPRDIGRKITAKTRAIICVDWAGKGCPLEIRDWNIPVIQDAAHSIGNLKYGDYACYSFQAIKHLTTGDGGAIVVPQWQYERAKKLRWYGLDRDKKVPFRFCQDIEEPGFKYHMNDIAASIGLANLQHLNFVLSRHKKNAKFYSENINNPKVKTPEYKESERHSWWLYTILVDDPNKFIEYMKSMNIETSPVHYRNDRYVCFTRYVDTYLPGVLEFFEHQVSIPVGWWLSPGEVEYIVDRVNNYS